MIHLILAGQTIVGTAKVVLRTTNAWETEDAIYPDVAGVTDVVRIPSLPADFATNRYVWQNGKLERLPDPPLNTPVPVSVTALQARRALLAAGLLDRVDDAVKAAPRDVQIAWEYATTIVRDDPTLVAMARAIGLADAKVDDLFRQAAQL